MIPAEWIIQNLTALDTRAMKGSPYPIVDLPTPFPILGSKIYHSGKGVQGTIVDFHIKLDKKIWIKAYVASQNTTFDSAFSKAFVEQQCDMRNPLITRLMTQQDLADLHTIQKNGRPLYMNRSFDYILQHMVMWKPVSYSDKMPLKMLCMVPSKDDPASFRPVWKTPSQALDHCEKKSMIRFTSVESCEYLDEEQTEMTSCVSNAVNGNVYLNHVKRKEEVFFTTKNCRGLSFTSDPPFKPFELKKAATVDILNPPIMLGYLKANEVQREGCPKNMVMWSEVSQAFYNLYVWVVSRKTNKIFQGRNNKQLRQMFYDEDQPELLEIFEFLEHGFHDAHMDAEKFPWINWFVKEILMCDLEDLQYEF